MPSRRRGHLIDATAANNGRQGHLPSEACYSNGRVVVRLSSFTRTHQDERMKERNNINEKRTNASE